MRSFVAACAIVAALAPTLPFNPVHAQQNWMREAIVPETRSHDFGTVARAAKTEHRFVITNTLNSDMHIRSVRASCGCTTPIVETEWIKPGESGTILARFNTGTFTGQRAATLTVSIDRPIYTELQLNVRGYIRSDVVFAPGEASFGEVPEGESKTIHLSLDYAGRSDWQILGIDSPSELIDIAFEEASRGGGRVQYNLTATLSEDAPAGAFLNQFVLRTNDRRLKTVPLLYSAQIQPPLIASPSALQLGDIKRGEAIPLRFAIKGREAFRVLDVVSESGQIEFQPSDVAKTAHLINMKMLPSPSTSDGGIVNSAIIVKTDLEDREVRIDLSYRILSQSADVTVASSRGP